MPCYHPLQASYSLDEAGMKKLSFTSALSEAAAKSFRDGLLLPDFVRDSVLTVPCGVCMGCRLERSRQWATRCMHEASLYEDNCFITLTYNDENLPKDGSLDKKHFQSFMKRLRSCYADTKIRFYGCGEYGDNFHRPHYHACLFNFDFPDKLLWKRSGVDPLYTSDSLERLWGMGFCTIGTLTFDSAAYVARYCTKKVNGSAAVDYYAGRQPEYAVMSLKPGIGYGWYDKWKEDCFPSDYLVTNGAKCKPPRYYDKLLEKEDPMVFAKVKELRVTRRESKDSDDETYRRLLDREKCQEARFKQLIRTIERR